MHKEKTEVVVDGITYHRLTEAQETLLEFFDHESYDDNLNKLRTAHYDYTYKLPKNQADLEVSEYLYVLHGFAQEFEKEAKEMLKKGVAL